MSAPDRLYILAFDHRGSFQKKMFGIDGEPSPEERETISSAKSLIYEGLEKALELGCDPRSTGALVDEEFGADVARKARARGLTLAMPMERSGQKVFDFEFGDDFPAHIEEFDLDYAKVLVRYNPEGDEESNAAQRDRLRRLSDHLAGRGDRGFLFELLVPAEDHQLARVDGDAGRYDREVRPGLMVTAIEQLREAGIEPDVWKIEGLDDRADCERIAALTRDGGRDHVTCVVLGRGADDEQVADWLRAAAPVEGYRGFAIGRSIWWGSVAGWLEGSLSREQAAERIASSYRGFIDVYQQAAAT